MTDPDRLYILWTNADEVTSEKMVMMYSTNCMLRHWWEKVTVIIWGATARLAAENETIREKIRIAMQAGVEFTACKACADQLEVTGKLAELGVDVRFWGEPLTRLIKDHENLLTL